MEKKRRKKWLALCLAGILTLGQPSGVWASFEAEEIPGEGFVNMEEAPQETENGDLVFSPEDPSKGEDTAISRQVFPDRQLLTVVQEDLDLDGDGFLSQAEKAAVTVLDLSGKGIRDFTGISLFTELEELNCSGNDAEELDVAALTKLRKLNVTGNSVTTLDVSQLTRLESLICDYTGLWFVDVRNCPLKEFSASGIYGEVAGDCLDFSQWPGITRDNLSNLQNGQWTEDGILQAENIYEQITYTWKVQSAGIPVTASAHVSLGYRTSEDFPDPVLNQAIQGFFEGQPEKYSPGMLAEIRDLYMEDENLKSLEGIRYLPNLADLSVSGGQLTEADLGGNKNLTSVTLNSLPLEQLQLGSLPLLEVLNVSDTLLRQLDVSGCGNLQYLTADRTKLEEPDLRRNRKIRSLSLAGCGSLKDLKLAMNTDLEYLDVSGCGLEEDLAGRAVKLKTYLLSDNQLTSLDLRHYPLLQKLDGRFNWLGETDTKENPQLQSCLLYPMREQTVQLGSDSVVHFSDLGNFQLQNNEKITDVQGAVCTQDQKGFYVAPFTGEETTIRFSIENPVQKRTIGTCSIRVLPNQTEQPVLDAPVLREAVSGGNIKISWEPVEYAAGYRVYRRPAGTRDKWTIVANVPAGTTTFYNKKVPLNTKFTYTVRAKGIVDGKTYWSSYDSRGVQAVAILQAPKLLSVSQTVDPTIQWKKVTGVHGYRIYRREPGISWKLIGEVSDTALSYTDTQAVPGMTHIYTVRGFKQLDDTQDRGPYQKTGIRVRNQLPEGNFTGILKRSDGNLLKWDPTEGVTGYQIDQAPGKTGPWKRLAQLKGDGTAAFKDTEKEYGPETCYRIRCYKTVGQKTYYGAYSDPAGAGDSLVKGAFDFSEYHMAWNLSGESPEGFDRGALEGGTIFMAAAYLARWDGPVDEASAPYSQWENDTPNQMETEYHVQNVYFLPERRNALDNGVIKQAVMKYGGVAASYVSIADFYSDDNVSYYLSYGNPWSSEAVPHDITIIGWDDNYSRENFRYQPQGDGAFLCKNSWGDSWGDNGCFYISYYDEELASRNASAVFTGLENSSNYDRIYQYDPLGATATYGYDSQIYQANVFPENGGVLETEELLQAVSFYVYDAGYDYEVYGITDYQGKESFQKLGKPLASGTAEYAGYHTVELKQPLGLKAGSRFAVVVRLKSPGETYGYFEVPIVGRSSNARAAEGESFISQDGSRWWDMQDRMENTNACVKAFTNIPAGAGKNVASQPEGLLQTQESQKISGRVYDCQEVLAEGFEVDVQEEPYSGNTDICVPVGNTVLMGEGEFPSAYDLREHGRVSAIKDQGSADLCWAFAAYGSLESCALGQQ